MMDESSAATGAPKMGGVNSLCILGEAITSDDPIVTALKNFGLHVNFVK